MIKIKVNEDTARNYLISRCPDYHFSKEQIPENIKSGLETFIKSLNMDLKGLGLFFSEKYCKGCHWLNSNSGFFFSRYITVNYEWMAKIIFDGKCRRTQNAFKISMGHELSHRSEPVKAYRLIRSKAYFIHWVIEIYADFSGTGLMCNSSQSALLDSIDYKRSIREKAEQACQKKQRASRAYPSWDEREKYAETGAFNKELIHIIAEDFGYKNKSVIERIARKFKNDIILK